MSKSEFVEAYEDDRRLRGAILTEPISRLKPREPVVVGPDASVEEAVGLMNSQRCGCVLVVEDDRLVGIFSERDLLRLVHKEESPKGLAIKSVMTPEPETLRPEHGIALALHAMSDGGYRHVPLVDEEGRPVGVVAMRDIVRFIVSLFPDAVLTAPPDPHAVPKEYGG